MAIVDSIKNSYVFRRLNPEQLDKVAQIAHEVTYEPGQYIFKAGRPARSFYIIERGKVELQVGINIATSYHVSVQEQTVEKYTERFSIITQGMCLGWSTLVRRDVFYGAAQAIDKCKLIALDGNKLQELMDTDVTLGYEVMKQFAQEITNCLDALGKTLVVERGLALLYEVPCY